MAKVPGPAAAGVYSSTLASAEEPLEPPMTSTWPFDARRVAVWKVRAALRLPASEKAPELRS